MVKFKLNFFGLVIKLFKSVLIREEFIYVK